MNTSHRIEYSQYLVAFLDILGFRNMVFEKENDKISTYFSLINEITNDLKRIQSKKDIGSITISDSVILSIPLGGSPLSGKIKKLRELCIAIQKIQFKLSLNNIWIRGAISFGNAYFNERENQVVGEAYINAYELEQKIAIYPRVVIDSRLIEHLNFDSADNLIREVNNYKLYGSEYNPIERNVIYWWNYNYGERRKGLTNDTPLFIDYLVYALQKEEYLDTIIKNIRKNMYSDNNIYPKFRWVVDYLIQCCEFQTVHIAEIDPDKIRNNLLKLRQL